MKQEMKLEIRNRLIKLLSQKGFGVEGATIAADHLVANGVTVQEWIPVSKRLPEVNTAVLGFLWGTTVDIVWINGRTGNWASEYVNEYKGWEITHWMPLPQAPKEDNNHERL